MLSILFCQYTYMKRNKISVMGLTQFYKNLKSVYLFLYYYFKNTHSNFFIIIFFYFYHNFQDFLFKSSKQKRINANMSLTATENVCIFRIKSRFSKIEMWFFPHYYKIKFFFIDIKVSFLNIFSAIIMSKTYMHKFLCLCTFYGIGDIGILKLHL